MGCPCQLSDRGMLFFAAAHRALGAIFVQLWDAHSWASSASMAVGASSSKQLLLWASEITCLKAVLFDRPFPPVDDSSVLHSDSFHYHDLPCSFGLCVKLDMHVFNLMSVVWVLVVMQEAASDSRTPPPPSMIELFPWPVFWKSTNIQGVLGTISFTHLKSCFSVRPYLMVKRLIANDSCVTVYGVSDHAQHVCLDLGR